MSTNTIAELSSISHINDNDLFVVAHRDRYIHTQYNDESINSENLFDVLMSKILEDADLKNTIYHESSDFSLVEHKHDDKYNKVSLDFKYDIKDQSQAMLSIGNMFFDGTLSTIAIPRSIVQTIFTVSFTVVEPAVGTLKFIAKQNIGTNSTINYKSDDFDGWLYPNGDTFNLVDFSLSNTLNILYGNSNGTFTLPDIRNFLKYNSTIDGNSLIDYSPSYTSLPYHTHNVDLQLTGTADIVLSIRIGKQAGDTPSTDNYNMAHSGNGKLTLSQTMKDFENTLTPTQLKKFKQNDTLKMPQLKMRLKKPITFNNSISILDNTPEYGETYPTHIILPVMMYVGQRKRRLI